MRSLIFLAIFVLWIVLILWALFHELYKLKAIKLHDSFEKELDKAHEKYEKKINNIRTTPLKTGGTLFAVVVRDFQFVSYYSIYSNSFGTSASNPLVFGLYKDAQACADTVGGKVVTLITLYEEK